MRVSWKSAQSPNDSKRRPPSADVDTRRVTGLAVVGARFKHEFAASRERKVELAMSKVDSQVAWSLAMDVPNLATRG